MAELEQIPAKTILQKAGHKNDGWFGIDYNMNLYRGCCHGCIYCDSRSCCYQNEDFDRVRVKQNVLSILERELRVRKKTGVVGIGAMSDTYHPFERERKITRGALKLLAEYGYGVSLDTKSSLAVRDADVFREISKNHSVIVKFTITAADDDLASLIEPGAPSSSERFQAMGHLSRKGIYTGILMTPILPFVTDTEENIRNLIQKAAASGARFAFCLFGVTLRGNQRAYYYQQLESCFPGLADRYKTFYGDQYWCVSPKQRYLEEIFRAECEKNGLLYRMKDIVADYRKNEQCEQLTLPFS